MRLELRHDPTHVSLDRRGADHEISGDFLVRHSLTHESEDLALTFGQIAQLACVGARVAGAEPDTLALSDSIKDCLVVSPGRTGGASHVKP